MLSVLSPRPRSPPPQAGLPEEGQDAVAQALEVRQNSSHAGHVPTVEAYPSACRRISVSIIGHWQRATPAVPRDVAHPELAYRPRDAEAAVLHAVIREHLDDFLRATADPEGGGLPPFVPREFRESLTCGVLAHGFARLRCEGCALERLVPFSCKGRGFCPGCGGRRMTERAAHLVDTVLPWVPVRQWVLTLPYRLRYQLAWNHRLCLAVLGVYARTVLAFYTRRARQDGIAKGRSGTVTVIQRFGSDLNLNVHFHTLALDGVFHADRSAPSPPVAGQHPQQPRDDLLGLGSLLSVILNRVRRERAPGVCPLLVTSSPE